MTQHILPRLGIGAVIINEDNRILLILRKRHPEANTWSIPGGKVEPYETLQDTVIREIQEEIGVDITIDHLLCTAETITPELGEHWVSIIYVARITNGEPRNMEPEALGGLQWFALDDLPENLACFTVPAIEALRQQKHR